MKFLETIVFMVLGIALSFNIGGNMSCNAPGQYDYFQFVQESPFLFCKNINGKGCNILPLPRIFTIHGLWPSNFTHRHKPCINEASNDELRADLELSWRSFISGRSNMDFWEYEYNKHGKCSDDKFSQTQYFDRARSLWKQYKPHALFSNRSLEPGKSYSFTGLEQAIRSFIGGSRPLLLCEQSKRKKNKKKTK
ncbi:ribonuclease S-2 [Prunus persica]|uniref:ribonuclease S-2 n=1 Tax=Prunus persica TaxID=3760 RepID=UPI0009ABA7D1|nr:ribonuclease S-2 [Prunus persica]